ncbi:uncharacterized protein MYCFIDRAFT_172535 [Pseudocercospora fijiensis CIRAD86]|uniref:Uncharacterized protein n=1 Tax=Pseudocercospora fijiensis (strain CIRAD86) TaxID=383855 RepID=M2ZAK6_PSEFD|nr:uncharacterized protein MYCFIDRAFT_172535 [Pseudocercospora fijiensis CIRAD86]EME86845.1 hypothetical protein MYCFIDRAFT_172535 [Pseudocercospora fijiensis CIRAD86]
MPQGGKERGGAQSKGGRRRFGGEELRSARPSGLRQTRTYRYCMPNLAGSFEAPAHMHLYTSRAEFEAMNANDTSGPRPSTTMGYSKPVS